VNISSNLPDVVDNYISLRAQRLSLDKQVADLKKQEEEIKDHLISEFRSQGLSALGGKAGICKLHMSVEPEVTDWPTLYTHIKETDNWDLLHRRLTTTAVKLRWEEDETVPGVGKYEAYKLTVSTK